MKARADDLLEGLAEREAAMQRAKEAAEMTQTKEKDLKTIAARTGAIKSKK